MGTTHVPSMPWPTAQCHPRDPIATFCGFPLTNYRRFFSIVFFFRTMCVRAHVKGVQATSPRLIVCAQGAPKTRLNRLDAACCRRKNCGVTFCGGDDRAHGTTTKDGKKRKQKKEIYCL
ncbi:hypothetical protein TW95_gp1738 [Pandoravirus inopinatum]|uniref:Uncharacterized protein n=1 Tax=Pandoravirus inopinatum TaxID=1605721 RepID=A0A0B5JF54_9VIRU|nr:hypothetical protein TW95_gp1738 [Pandoravirus inopinatum]AJF98472.1 hypothetical protein [Pandoravirus inopinatum]